MARTIEATIDEQGTVHLSEAVALPTPQRALVTILDEEPVAPSISEGLRRGFADMQAGRTISLGKAQAEFDALWTARFGSAPEPIT